MSVLQFIVLLCLFVWYLVKLTHFIAQAIYDRLLKTGYTGVYLLGTQYAYHVYICQA